MTQARVLLVDDDKSLCEWVSSSLARRSFATRWTTNPQEALQWIEVDSFDVVVVDLNMPGTTGLEVCQRVNASRPDIPVIVITAFGSLETAVAAIRSGAYDFVTKPFDLDVLAIALNRAAQHRNLREEVRRLRENQSAADPNAFPGLLGESAAMVRLRELLGRVAGSDASILVTGESGTGKEVVAKGIHELSPRRGHPLVAINCAALPETLLEAELFGHVKGAFTDAKTSRAGLFRDATGGTLFLDEIGDLPLGLQPKLLRALEQRTARPIGGSVELPFDVRIISATSRDLQAAVEEGKFREDLYYRFNVIEVETPPLRARGNDVLLLAQHFISHFAEKAKKPLRGISHAAAERLSAYAWPGNVRELRNCMERAVALAQLEDIRVEDLPERVRAYRASHVVVTGDDPTEFVTLEELERRYILRVLDNVQDNKTTAAKILGLDRATLYRKLERYGSKSS